MSTIQNISVSIKNNPIPAIIILVLVCTILYQLIDLFFGQDYGSDGEMEAETNTQMENNDNALSENDNSVSENVNTQPKNVPIRMRSLLLRKETSVQPEISQQTEPSPAVEQTEILNSMPQPLISQKMPNTNEPKAENSNEPNYAPLNNVEIGESDTKADIIRKMVMNDMMPLKNERPCVMDTVEIKPDLCPQDNLPVLGVSRMVDQDWDVQNMIQCTQNTLSSNTNCDQGFTLIDDAFNVQFN